MAVSVKVQMQLYAIDKGYADLTKQVFEQAAELAETVVHPWCKKHNLHFIAGNGGYYISDEKGNRWDDSVYGYRDHPKFTKTVFTVLQHIPDGFPQSLGSMMPDCDYRRKDKLKC